MAGAAQGRGVERRGIALIRVSKARGREDLISPDLQDRAIEPYMQRKNIRLIDRVEALDESGSQENSKWWRTLETVVARVEAGEADVVVVWKFSRAARHRRRWAVAIDRIEVAGGSLESATEDVDTSTSTGQFTRGMLAEIAAWEAQRTSEGWKEVKERRARLGLADGQPRFGYLIVDRTYIPDPAVGPALVECYERAVQGESIESLALWLNAQGHPTPKGSLWRGETLRVSMRNGFAAGLIRYKTDLLPGAHEALIGSELWTRFQQTNGLRKTGWNPTRKHLFTGLLRCAYCQGPLHSYRQGKAYRCFNQERYRNCPQGGVTAWVPSVQQVIADWLAYLVAHGQADYERIRAEERKRPKVNVTPLRRQLTKTETSLVDLARKNLEGFYDDATYLALRADLLDTQQLLGKQIQEATVTEAAPPPFRRVQEVWRDQTLPVEERRLMLTDVLSHVLVRKLALGDGPKYEPVPLWWDSH